MTAPNEATARQIQAATPGVSTWLSANAGSGKTRVLTDRVARLLLDGTSPQNILCLTYTKAAASEMQNRLFKRLGAWAMTPDDILRGELAELGVTGTIDARRLTLARTLFARAIETPGGLKIQTIHSFCASLLRRFPLEAGVSPQFTEMDDRAADLLVSEIVEEMAETLAPEKFDALARFFTGDDASFGALVKEMTSHRDRFFPPRDRDTICAAFDIPPDLSAQDIIGSALLGNEADLIAKLLPHLRAGSKMDIGAAENLATLDITQPTLQTLAALEGILLTGAGAKQPFSAKIGTFPTKGTQKNIPDMLPHLDALMLRIEDARPRRLALQAVEKSCALHDFAAVFLPLYEARKLAKGWLDFEDLILKARDLMTDPAVAEWVLFRLDGGIDHILVDEAQDTSPAQWQVVERLAQEFAAGDGIRAAADRSLFVVGDLKQSIYSFQGADPESFERMFNHFRDRLADTAPLQRLELQYSFRSSAAILRAVDTVFGGTGAEPLNMEASHRAFHDALPGRVDLWPVLENEPAPEDTEWFDPVDRQSPNAAPVVLAQRIAGEIRRLIDEKETIPAQDGTRRPVTEGDFLILVQGRKTALFSEIIRACKQAGLAIAGADRLKLGGELAVRDLRALLAFLATPEDDLSLACALRSPLFGWSEGALYDLAAGRDTPYLWTALRNRRGDFPETLTMIDALRREADFLRPYDLLDRILLRHGGRNRLLARLGDEAQDGLDELLNQALAYERMDVPSLTGFLTWLDVGDVEVKRQSDSAGNRIRVMTVHGAKGLEAPIVILPDTLRTKKDIRQQIFPEDGIGVLWRTAKTESPPLIEGVKADLVARDDAERARLLYVAMTRAETWLIVCGAGKPMKNTWYANVEDAMAQLPCETVEFPTGAGLRLSHGDWAGGEAMAHPPTQAVKADLPDWIARHAPVPAEPRPILRPSDLGGAKALPGDNGGLTEDQAMARGTALHLLLEKLPGHPPDTWPDLATGLVGADAAALLPEVTRVLAAPDLAFLFQPDGLSEVDIAAALPASPETRMFGTIDRLLIGDDRVLAVDFKSNVVVPDTADAVPDGVLRQMALYHAALGQVFPGKTIETAILWTAIARFMPLPDDILRDALQRVASP
ncbi:double-strand break repair helicase AddA [Oceaniglobus indicus]|uniref:double-strand break repair helicase AddA n=1 Tax=Oceaniglobus indicus TaxID=2047749 RepID=UPI000C19B962|nr:double-strand break repair helicase AddA [Oceaniglobus indicus]